MPYYDVADSELEAMAKVLKATEALTDAQRTRVFAWVIAKTAERGADAPVLAEAA